MKTKHLTRYAQMMVLFAILLIIPKTVWGEDTSVAISFGTTSGYWAAHSSASYTDSDERSWSRTYTAGNKSSGQAAYSQFGNSSNTCTSLVLTATAGSAITLKTFSVSMEGASESTAGTIYLYKRTSGGTETQLGTASVNGTTSVTCSMSSNTSFDATDILKVSYVGTAKAIKITTLSYSYAAGSGCSNSVAVTEGSESHGEVTTISSASIATCSATASDRRVTITITPNDCYDAPSALTWTKSSGTVTASKQSGPTDNGDGTFSYVYQFAQNDNGAGTFGVTCTAKAAGKRVNFDAGPGTSASAYLTETCDGAGVTLPSVTASGVCKGWTTFAGWATAAVSDSSTTSVTVYAAGSKFIPSSNNQTLYAVYSKTKGGGSSASWVLSTSAPTVDDSIMVAYYTGSAYQYMKNSGADNATLTVSSGIATPVANGKFKVVSGSSYGVSFQNGSNYLHLNSSAINVTTNQTNADLNISAGSSTNSFIIKRHSGASTYDRVLAWTSSNNWTSSSSMNSGCEVYFFKRTTSTTYYCSDPNCCTSLGTINGSKN